MWGRPSGERMRSRKTSDARTSSLVKEPVLDKPGASVSCEKLKPPYLNAEAEGAAIGAGAATWMDRTLEVGCERGGSSKTAELRPMGGYCINCGGGAGGGGSWTPPNAEEGEGGRGIRGEWT